MNAPLIGEEWLSKVGFKWERLDRQPTKHWTLWIGSAVIDYRGSGPGLDSLGIEIAKIEPNYDGCGQLWHCWIRSDVSGRYSRIVHVRTLSLQAEVEKLIEALIGYSLNWSNVFYGALRTPFDADRLRQDQQRLDARINAAWTGRVDQELGVAEIDRHKTGISKP